MKKIFSFTLALAFFASCANNSQNQTAQEQEAPQQAPAEMPMSLNTTAAQVNIGDKVPSDLVCMVNNDYMGTEQLIVEVNGKTYYGCCEMCQERLPVDEAVRVAIDPVSQNQVDKADAIIAVTGGRGEVSYFESEDTYQKYVQTMLN